MSSNNGYLAIWTGRALRAHYGWQRHIELENIYNQSAGDAKNEDSRNLNNYIWCS